MGAAHLGATAEIETAGPQGPRMELVTVYLSLALVALRHSERHMVVMFMACLP